MKRRGDCFLNQSWMKVNCRRTCRFCEEEEEEEEGCPDDYKIYSGRCFKVYPYLLRTLMGAFTHCRLNGDRLFIAKTKAEQDLLFSMDEVGRSLVFKDYWIGLTNINSGNRNKFFWLGENYTPTTWINWNRQEECPDGFEEKGDFCYLFEAEEVTFDEANAACQAKNSILVEPKTEEINTIVKSYGVRLWLGATDKDEEGTWVWQSDNEVMTYNDWGPNQPNNLRGEQHCLSMQRSKWDDLACDLDRAYICQAEKEIKVDKNMCTVASKDNRQWRDYKCRKKLAHFVCEKII